MDSARALIARGWGVSLVSRCLRVSRAQLHVILRRTDDWMDGRRSRHTDDTDVLLRIHHVIGELPTYGYRRVPSGTKIWLVASITDMRNGFNGLAAKVQTALKDDPMSGHVFIFLGRSGSQVKLLWSTGDGLCLLTKRLERGRFAWPSARDGKVFLTQAQLAMLLEGIDWRQPKRLLTSMTML